MAHTTIAQGNIIRFPVERCRRPDPLTAIIDSTDAALARIGARIARQSELGWHAPSRVSEAEKARAAAANVAAEAEAIRVELREGEDERHAQFLESVAKHTGYSLAVLAQLDPLEVIQIDCRDIVKRLDAARDKPIGSVRLFDDAGVKPQDKPTKKQSTRAPKRRSPSSKGGSK